MLRRVLAVVAINVMVLTLLVVIAEGAASLTLKIWDSLKNGISVRDNRVRERLHTRYDAELGWVNLPGFRDPDLYGPGVELQTNAQGFREREDLQPEPAPGVFRAFCIGDSFTLGYGVGNEQTWCHYLEGMQPGLETVNMGQGGYGMDQAWLWYRRDAAAFRHQAVIFALIDEDIERLRNDTFAGYPKPFLSQRDGELVITNSPLPENSYTTAAVRFSTFISRFELYHFVARAATKLRRDITGPRARMSWPDAQRVMEGILDDLARRTEVTPIMVYLPTVFDNDTEMAVSARNRGFLAAACAARGIRFIDLVADRDAIRRAALFPELIGPLHGHYTAVANRAVAQVLTALVGPQLSLSAHVAPAP